MKKPAGNKAPTRDIGVGKVLYEENKTSTGKELFVVAGSSYDEIALLRLFECTEVNDLLIQKCYTLSRYLITSEAVQLSLPLYADISRIIAVPLPDVRAILEGQPERVIGRLYKQDINAIIAHLRSVSTIPRDTFNKYFDLN